MANENNQTTVEWELSKENVQPLRHGRKVANLSAALQPLTGDQLSKVREQRQAFEVELRTYNGSDPLDVWYRYIKWTEENYPKGGKDGHMLSLLEKCVGAFKDHEQYKNDQRYLEVWIKFSNYTSDPLEVYTFLYDQGIGCELALLFESWTWELEQVGNTQKADALYKEGINRGAEPVDRLERSYREFQARVVRQTTLSLAEATVSGPMEQERTAFGELRGRGKHQTVGSIRTGVAQKASRGGLNIQQAPPQQRGQKFQIFSDENQMPVSSVPPQTGEWTTVPTRAVTNRENEQDPGIWTKAKVSQKTTGVVPISSVSNYNRPSFTVHTDDSLDQNAVTPRKPPEFGNPVLSARKPSKEMNTLDHINQITHQDLSQIAMYKKELIYNGVEEFQFEEIRAARWMEKKRERDRKEQERLLQEQRETLQREMAKHREDMQRQMDALHQRELALQRTQDELMARLQRGLDIYNKDREESFACNNDSLKNSVSDPPTGGAANVSVRQPGPAKQMTAAPAGPSQMCSTDPTVTRHLAFDDFTLYNNLPVPDSSTNSQSKPISQNAQTNCGANNNSMHTPGTNNSIHNNTGNSGSLSGKSLGRSASHTPDSASSVGRLGKNTPTRSSIAPSPTFNTKEAFQVVMGMFTDSVKTDHGFGWSQPAAVAERMDTGAPGDGGLFGGGPAPFKIFDENSSSVQNKGFKAPSVPSKDENDENRAPSGYNQPPRRKALGGILQPAGDMPYMATEDQNSPSEQQDEQMDGIEISNFQYRDDITLAPLGSQQEFAAAAHHASTPFNPSIEQLNMFKFSQSNSSRKIDLSDGPGADKSQPMEQTPQADPESYIDGVNKEKSGLSPILELSEDDLKSVTGNSTGASHQGNPGNHASHVETRQMEKRQVAPIDDPMSCRSKSPANQSYHVIDTSGFFLTEDKTEALSMSIAIDPRDPFDAKAIQTFLSCLSEPISTYPGYHRMEGCMPGLKIDHHFNLGDDMYALEKKLGQGGFATVYLVHPFDFDYPHNVTEECVMKVQKPPCPWEFYICATLQRRLADLGSPMDVSKSVMSVDAAYFYDDCSCLLNELHKNGTLLDVVNIYRTMPTMLSNLEPFATYITIELLHIVEQLHKCKIIHGDIKPDNFLVRDPVILEDSRDPAVLFGTETKVLKLIDFGQSIDMTMYPKGTAFTSKVNTSGFQCIEMKTDQPWTYQTDLFGLIGTIHVVIFGEYMNIYQEGGKWKTTSHFSRKWNSSLWKEFFDAMLNIPSCTELPDLAYFRRRFEEHFIQSLVPAYIDVCKKLLCYAC